MPPPFDQWALNPYMGCSHACAYCYVPDVVFLSSATDPYQPAEGRHRITRRCLELLLRAGWPAAEPSLPTGPFLWGRPHPSAGGFRVRHGTVVWAALVALAVAPPALSGDVDPQPSLKLEGESFDRADAGCAATTEAADWADNRRVARLPASGCGVEFDGVCIQRAGSIEAWSGAVPTPPGKQSVGMARVFVDGALYGAEQFVYNPGDATADRPWAFDDPAPLGPGPYRIRFEYEITKGDLGLDLLLDDLQVARGVALETDMPLLDERCPGALGP